MNFSRLVRGPEEMARLARSWRRAGHSIGLVPTMGALHAGHESLMRRARRENGRVVLSIFVNPAQFGPKEDFTRYPRTPAADAGLAAACGMDAIFAPSARAMYPEDFSTAVEVRGLSDTLCGVFRPGHFSGVATVVLKLLETTRPDRAYFGEKDFQQLAVVSRMAADLGLPVRIVPCPTVREPDGLALSSRNRYLSPDERAKAPALAAALRWAAAEARKPGRTPAGLTAGARRLIRRDIPGARIDYVSLVDPSTLGPAERLRGRLRLLAAVRIRNTRLIDNIDVLC